MSDGRRHADTPHFLISRTTLSPSPPGLKKRGNKYFKDGTYELALIKYHEALKLSGFKIPVLTNLSLVCPHPHTHVCTAPP